MNLKKIDPEPPYGVSEHTVRSTADFIQLAMHFRRRGKYLFRGQASRRWGLGVGHKLPDFDQKTYDRKISRFIRRCQDLPEFRSVKEGDYLRWLAYAQRYGMRTKLLDWSTNPLVALYFACRDCPDDGLGAKDADGAVWLLGLDEALSPEAKDKPRDRIAVVGPPPADERFLRQSAKFTYHADPAVDLAAAEEAGKYRLVKIVFKHAAKAEALNELGVMGVHHSSLFPEVEGIARFLENEYPNLEAW
jgi:hypothetical protein